MHIEPAARNTEGGSPRDQEFPSKPIRLAFHIRVPPATTGLEDLGRRFMPKQQVSNLVHDVACLPSGGMDGVRHDKPHPVSFEEGRREFATPFTEQVAQGLLRHPNTDKFVQVEDGNADVLSQSARV